MMFLACHWPISHDRSKNTIYSSIDLSSTVSMSWDSVRDSGQPRAIELERDEEPLDESGD